MENNKKKIWILIGVIVVIVLIIIVAASQSQKGAKNQSPEGTGNLTGEENPAAGEESPVAGEVNEVVQNAQVEVPGTNLITTDNKVITQEGLETKNDVSPMSTVAPQQSGPVPVETLSSNVVKIKATVGVGYEPAEFTVNSGAAVTMSLTSTDKSHGLVFDDASLQAIGIAVAGGETRAITFNAPTKAGEYTFHCTLPPHAGAGEVGKMIVR